MARPKKSAQDSRTHQLPAVRCNAWEYERITERAKSAGLSQSAYLRQMALYGKVQIKQSRTDTAVILQLRRIGVNLNQLTHAAHLGQPVQDELHVMLTRIRAILDEAIK